MWIYLFSSSSFLCFQYKDFTTDPENFPAGAMKSFIETLHQNGQHYGWLLCTFADLFV